MKHLKERTRWKRLKGQTVSYLKLAEWVELNEPEINIRREKRAAFSGFSLSPDVKPGPARTSRKK